MYIGWLLYLGMVVAIAGGIVLTLFIDGVIDLLNEKRGGDE